MRSSALYVGVPRCGVGAEGGALHGGRPEGRPEGNALEAFSQGVRSGAGEGELSWSESRLARVANHQTQPRERTMTIDRMTLKALLEKGSDDDLLRE
jgi:hypothetical protein